MRRCATGYDFCSCGGELVEVVGGDLIDAAQQELAKPSGLFDLAGDRLDDLLARPISAAMAGAAELGAHRLHERPAARFRAVADRGAGAAGVR